MELQVVSKSQSNVRFKIKTINSTIVVNDGSNNNKIIDGKTSEKLKTLVEWYPINRYQEKIYIDSTEIKTVEDGILLLYSTYFSEHIYNLIGEELDVAFAHAFPISLFPHARANIIPRLEEIILLHQLVILPSKEFVLANTSALKNLKDLKAKQIYRHHKKLFKKNSDLVITSTRDLTTVFKDWNSFCVSRFGAGADKKLLDFFQSYYTVHDCLVKEFWWGEQCICRNLLLYDNDNRTIYDVLAPWNQLYKNRRLGIFSGVINLLEAIESEYKYSLCYGNFLYKMEILKFV
jgi:hypothetical protein